MAETSSGTILNLLFVDGCSREGKGGERGETYIPFTLCISCIVSDSYPVDSLVKCVSLNYYSLLLF